MNFRFKSPQKNSIADPDALTRIEYASVAGDTNRGLVRRRNEDSFFYALNSDCSRLIAVVADGIGGNENGDIASRLVCKMLLMHWRGFADRPEITPEIAAGFLADSIIAINRSIFAVNTISGDSKPMGSTIAVLIVMKKWIVTAHCGDSRIYRWRNGNLELLTSDHSVVNELIMCGKITEEEAKTHPYAHIITRSVGTEKILEPELHSGDRQPGDRFLLCSDGLDLHVEGREIAASLSAAFEPSQTVNDLMRLTLQRGARDNTTILSIFA